ncbi:methionyl-tRNA formyltransferase, partial [Bacillus cereus group sp. BC64]
PILPDDTATQVFDKVTVAAEQTLWRVLPALLAGEGPHLPNDLPTGSYYGGRKPEDGPIDWSKPAAQVYNLVRAVAPPYPGAFTD